MATTSKTTTIVTVVCDGPHCASHNNGAPVTLTWKDEEVAENHEALPDAAARLIRVQFGMFAKQLHEFCGPRCLRDYLDYSYVPPLSPREQAVQDAASIAAKRD